MKGLVAHLKGLSGKFCLVISIEVVLANVRETEMVSMKQRRKKQQKALNKKTEKIVRLHAQE